MTKYVCTSELVWTSERRHDSCVMFGVTDNSAHEHEISAARNGMCQTSGERKDEEEERDKEKIF